MRFSAGFSHKTVGMIFSRRRSSHEQPPYKVRGKGGPVVRDRQPQMRDAGFEVVHEAACRGRRLRLGVSEDAGGFTCLRVMEIAL